MKRAVCLLTILMLCMCMVVPVCAAEEDGFVPSIVYKPEPEIIPVVGEDQQEHIAVIQDEAGESVQYVDEGCLDVTPIAQIWDDKEETPEDVKELLQTVYTGLNDGTLAIAYEKHNAGLDASKMVIRDLFDARFYCQDCPKALEPEGAVMELTFDLGVVADAEIYVQTFDEETQEWSPIVKTVNNGDGTVTCTFEHLCAIAFSMPIVSDEAPAEVSSSPNVMPWIVMLIVAAAACVAVVVVKNKKAKV